MTAKGGQTADARPWLVSSVGALLLALSLEHVVEVMRALPVEPVPNAPAFVLGIGLIRGELVPVVDAGVLLIGRAERADRLVSLRIAGRPYALLVGSVLGVRRFGVGFGGDPPPLLRHIGNDLVSAIGLLDQQFLIFLATALIVPESLLEIAATDGGAA